ncbi:sulfide/dihydroorotate dehydrogenase-like FAD/NAD-binding protein [Listeria sp. PSOL-1]|uniref:sulfide/dihydroorotate dehydrogenase-like FAD/NAD-binding protein n=1 Tax=Listeria sp. PSOL-1 TaxID=1844999 RepID=UPI0018D7E0A0|nr:sulfide/dihydroorotate dehydrogenase-like FAD/NAD-binding protein [Listeria sp. PSOL-1]
MYKIIKMKQLTDSIYDCLIEAKRIASSAHPGQFIIVRKDEFAERIPLTIVEADKETGVIRIIFQVIGKSTRDLARLKTKDTLRDVAGPLGQKAAVKEYGTVLLVGGGVGIAALFPIIKALKEAGNHVITILGAKTANLLMLTNECRTYSDELLITTDDGSLGSKGLVTDVMTEIFQKTTIDQAWAIGPGIMMKFCTEKASYFKVPIYVSLNPIMIDGTGMCGGCRVTVKNSMKFACVDGPEFNGAEVNWTDFLQRMKQYQQEEITANEKQVKS